MPMYARQPAGKTSHRRSIGLQKHEFKTNPNSQRAAIVPSRSGIPKPRRAETRIQNQTQSAHHRTRRFVTIHHFSSQFRVYAGRLRAVPRNPTQALTSITELETKANFCALDAQDSAILPQQQTPAQIQNQTQSTHHPTHRFIAIHHFSSQFRLYASRLPDVPRNPPQALTSPLARSSYKAASLTRHNSRLYLGVESLVSGWKF